MDFPRFEGIPVPEGPKKEEVRTPERFASLTLFVGTFAASARSQLLVIHCLQAPALNRGFSAFDDLVEPAPAASPRPRAVELHVVPCAAGALQKKKAMISTK